MYVVIKNEAYPHTMKIIWNEIMDKIAQWETNGLFNCTSLFVVYKVNKY